MPMRVTSRVGDGVDAVALETTLLVHGLPRGAAELLSDELERIVRAHGAEPAVVGVVRGEPIVGMTRAELASMMGEGNVPKANTANLGVLMARGRSAATTVSATMELAAGAGVRVFATGGLGGVHRGYGQRLDVSSDLMALARWPVAVVASGVKSLLDVESTREALEALGVPVVGFGTERFPAFYQRESMAGVDARFDDVAELARFVRRELWRSGRGVVVAHPIPAGEEIGRGVFEEWLGEAEGRALAGGATGRGVTPAVLGLLHEVSGGATLNANLALVRANADLAARLAAGIGAAGR